MTSTPSPDSDDFGLGSQLFSQDVPLSQPDTFQIVEETVLESTPVNLEQTVAVIQNTSISTQASLPLGQPRIEIETFVQSPPALEFIHPMQRGLKNNNKGLPSQVTEGPAIAVNENRGSGQLHPSKRSK